MSKNRNDNSYEHESLFEDGIKEVKEDATKSAKTKKEKFSAFFSADNLILKNAVIAIIIAATIAVATFALSKFLGENITTSEWYWVIIVAGATICLVGWVQKRIQIESAKVVCIIVLCLALPMLILNTIWTGTTLPELKKKFSTTPDPVAQTKQEPMSDTIEIKESGIFYFELSSLQSVDKWLYVTDGLYYRLSVADDTPYPFFVKYKRGDVVKVAADKTDLPNKAGPFKIMAGEKSVKITLLITRHTT